MTKYHLLLAVGLCLLVVPVIGQDFVQFSTGAGYSRQAFINLADGSETQIENGAWDLAFTGLGVQDGGIHVNESTASTMGAPAAELVLYLAPTTDFATVINPSQLGARLYNDEKSWSWGAVNAPRDTSSALDYGWGVYQFTNHQIVGNRVFVLQLRNGNYRKFQVVSLAGNTYTLRHANLDGSDEQTVALPKSAARGGLLYFSFASNGPVETPPTQWDLLYCRYITPLDDGMGNIFDYAVTGILSAPGASVAVLRGAASQGNPDIQSASYATRLDAFGYDWKIFDFSQGWTIPDSLTYLVKTAAGEVYQLTPVDFEGSGTGTATFESQLLGLISSPSETSIGNSPATLFPNPLRTGQRPTLALDLPTEGELSWQVFDLNGRPAAVQATRRIPAGWQAYSLDNLATETLAAGAYVLRVQYNGQYAALPFVILP
jgi:hypothetical protein